MNRISIAVLTAALAVPLMTGCGGYNAEENTIFVLKNGRIVSTDVEPYDAELYEEGELEQFVKQTIESYNALNGEKAVVLKKLKIKNGIATLTLEYESDTVYTTFNGIKLFMGSIAESREEGYKYDGDFVSVKKGKAELCGVDDFLDNKSYKVAIFEGCDMAVDLPGKILYVSADCAELDDKNILHISQGSHMISEESTEGSESAATEATEAQEAATEEPTESETLEGGNDGGAITDDELLGIEEEPESQTEEQEEYFADDQGQTTKKGPVYVIYK